MIANRKYIGRTRYNGDQELIAITGDAYSLNFQWLIHLTGMISSEPYLIVADLDPILGPTIEQEGFGVAADYLEERGLSGAALVLREAIGIVTERVSS